MAGFPQRPIRVAFGQTKVMPVGRVIQNSKVELGPAPLNLTFDQFTGAGLLAPLLIAVVIPDATTGEFAFLTSLNDQDAGITLIRNSATEYAIRCLRGTVPNENGQSVTVAEAQAQPALLSTRLIATMSAEAQWQTELSLDSGSRVETEIVVAADHVDIVCTLVAQATARNFVVTAYARNGGST